MAFLYTQFLHANCLASSSCSHFFHKVCRLLTAVTFSDTFHGRRTNDNGGVNAPALHFSAPFNQQIMWKWTQRGFLLFSSAILQLLTWTCDLCVHCVMASIYFMDTTRFDVPLLGYWNRSNLKWWKNSGSTWPSKQIPVTDSMKRNVAFGVS